MTRVVEALPDGVAGERVDRVVAMSCDVPRTVAGELVDAGAVTLDGRVVTRRSQRVAAGSVLEVDVPDRDEAAAPVADPSVVVPVVHADEHLFVVDKPAGVVVHPGAGNNEGTLVHGLLALDPGLASVGEPFRPGIVHRLDRDTSGLMVVARTEPAREALAAALAGRRVTRRYRTLVWGHLADDRGLVDAPVGRSPRDPTVQAVVVGGREARTRYEVVARFRHPVDVSELTCLLETGRTHQIRVHLRALGHPVVGDRRYGGQRQSLPAPRQYLHAEHLAFDHPISGEPLQFDSPLPEDLAEVHATLS